MTRDDIPLLEKRPLVRLFSGHIVRIITPKMDNNFWVIGFTKPEDVFTTDRDGDTVESNTVFHLSDIVEVVPETV